MDNLSSMGLINCRKGIESKSISNHKRPGMGQVIEDCTGIDLQQTEKPMSMKRDCIQTSCTVPWPT